MGIFEDIESLKGLDVLHLDPGETLHLCIDVSISTEITVDLNKFKKDLEAYARELILASSRG